MRKGNQNGNPKKKEKRTEEKGIERLKRKKAGRRGNRSKGGKYEKRVEAGESIAFPSAFAPKFLTL